MRRAFKLHWTDANAFAGMIVWLLLPLAANKGLPFYVSILWLVMLGPLTIVPVAFGISRIDQAPSLLRLVLGLSAFPAALLLSFGICFVQNDADWLGLVALFWL